VVGLLAALLVLGMSSAPGWRELRWFSLCAALAAMFSLSNVLATLRVDTGLVLLGSRLSLFFGGLHTAAWFKYAAAQERRPMVRGERLFVLGLVGFSVASLVPGVLLESRLFIRDVRWLGLTYADAPLTRLGFLASIYFTGGLTVILVRFARRRARGDRDALAQCVAIGAVVAGGTHDALASSGLVDGVYLLDVALLVLVLAVGGMITTRFVASARALEVSSRKLSIAHEELVKRERLAALGELAAVVAHEVRNPLAVVFNATSGLRKATPGSSDHGALVDIVQEEAERLRDLVADLLEFARPRPPVLALAAIEDIVRGAVDAACSGTGAGVDSVALDLPEGVPAMACDERLVRQAVANLVSNALQTVDRRGPVRVEVVDLGERVAVRVVDDGRGVSAELRERIFTPFFSTRPTGSGLGLAVVRRCADAHGGDVLLTTTPGGGATFELQLPRDSA